MTTDRETDTHPAGGATRVADNGRREVLVAGEAPPSPAVVVQSRGGGGGGFRPRVPRRQVLQVEPHVHVLGGAGAGQLHAVRGQLALEPLLGEDGRVVEVLRHGCGFGSGRRGLVVSSSSTTTTNTPPSTTKSQPFRSSECGTLAPPVGMTA